MISSSHLHAMILHFPIALLITGFLSELIALFTKKEFFKTAAFYLLILGVVGTVAAYLSGNAAGEGIEEGPLKEPMELHEQAATITLWLAVIAATFSIVITYFKINFNWSKWVSVVLFLGVIGAISRTGYLGGHLVYNHGAGVEIGLPDFKTPANEAKDND
jgi:uncharacterized membrane protein